MTTQITSELEHVIPIHLTNGDWALVDEDDYPLVMNKTWRKKVGYRTSYAYWPTTIHDDRGRRTILTYMHRLIAKPADGMVVDHINNNGLDNRRCNLRVVPRGFNNQRTPYLASNVSGYRGARFDKARGLWRAEIRINERCRLLGRFRTAEEAARVYDQAAKEFYGPHAFLNFPTPKEEGQ